eukprot:gene23414-32703_t
MPAPAAFDAKTFAGYGVVSHKDVKFGPHKLISSPSVTCSGVRDEGTGPAYKLK